MQVPIACSLTAADATDRLSEWRAFISQSTVGRTREGGVVRLALVPSDDVLVAAADLARREKTCCPFFDFAIEIGPDGNTLRVEVPADAVQVLDDFAGLADAP